MQDKLETMFLLQNNLTKYMDLSRYPKKQEEKISVLCTAMIHEVIELQRITNWKWWKKKKKFHKKEAIEELIDIWHFIMQATIEMKIKPDELVRAYIKKHDINIHRQKIGY